MLIISQESEYVTQTYNLSQTEITEQQPNDSQRSKAPSKINPTHKIPPTVPCRLLKDKTHR